MVNGLPDQRFGFGYPDEHLYRRQFPVSGRVHHVYKSGGAVFNDPPAPFQLAVLDCGRCRGYLGLSSKGAIPYFSAVSGISGNVLLWAIFLVATCPHARGSELI